MKSWGFYLSAARQVGSFRASRMTCDKNCQSPNSARSRFVVLLKHFPSSSSWRELATDRIHKGSLRRKRFRIDSIGSFEPPE